jgi:serine/threonine-protein kinase
MAEVLLARMMGPAGFERPVVLKRILPHLADQDEFRTMFLDEARIVAGIHHPGVVTVFDFGDSEHGLYLVMEYLHGQPLSELRRRSRTRGERLDPLLSAHIVAEAADGLHAAHEYVDADGVPQNVVHRDVSPQNLYLLYDGSVKVIDFGIAKAANRDTKTATNTMKGKFAYMAPEQCDGSGVDRRADVFALGIVLFELLTGQRLFRRDNQLETVRAICLEPIPGPRDVAPHVPERLDAICRRALARSRDDRYATAAELRTELRSAIQQLAPERVPREELAAILVDWFAEERERGAELMRRRPLDASATVPTIAQPAAHKPRSLTPWIGVGGMLVGALGVWAVLTWSGGSAPEVQPEAGPSVPVAATRSTPADVEPPEEEPPAAPLEDAPVEPSVPVEPEAPPAPAPTTREPEPPRTTRRRPPRPSSPTEAPPTSPGGGFGRVD